MNYRKTAPARLRDAFRRATCVVCFVLVGAAANALDPNPPTLHSDRGAWPIHRQWNAAETRHYGEWIQHIYEMKSEGTREQRLAKLERVLTQPDMNLLLRPEFAGDGCNPQLEVETIRAAHRVVDCAKLTVALSTYYAYRRALPWTVSYVRAADGGDVRTASYTVPTGSASSIDSSSPEGFILDALTGVCTGNFRVELGCNGAALSDTLPVAISPAYLIPGCMYYLDGHVLILAKVTSDGEPRFIDATTSETRNIYAFNGFNAVSGLTPKQSSAQGHEYAGCYRGFRVFRWPIAEADSTGLVKRVRQRTDDEMREFGFATDQYDALEAITEKKSVEAGGARVSDFEQFVRLRMRTNARVNVDADLAAFADEMRALLEDRERQVQEGWRHVSDTGPIPFPEDSSNANVFTAGGAWGAYSTALADAGIRAKYFSLADRLDSAIALFDTKADEINLEGLNPHAVWTRADLAGAVLHAKNRALGALSFEYANTAGKPVRLTLLEVEKRLLDLSFDPNHPPELRWGAKPGSPEAGSAPDTVTPVPNGSAIAMAESYRREAYYRSLPRWEPEPSYLRTMFTEGFPVRDMLDTHLPQKWFDAPSPPLVPHGGRAAWLKTQAQAIPASRVEARLENAGPVPGN
ncbi:MAG: hypothetical protein HZB26_04200 [Candidatus Hydrogenedentes bacterium]|nr:hypothetical protein [Candidatus Hydrogenedentota bacterium]